MRRPLLAVGALLHAGIVLWLFVGGSLFSETAVLGLPTRDLFDHLWLHQWLGGALARGDSLTHLRLLAAPDGGVLLHPDPTGFLLFQAFHLVLPAVGAFNAALLGQVWLAALAGWLLCAEVLPTSGAAPGTETEAGSRSGRVLAGWVGGLALAASPFVVGQALGGETETAAVWVFVLGLWGLERAARTPTWRWGVLAGALGCATALAGWYYGAFWALYATAWAIRVRRPVPVLAAAGTSLVGVAGPAAWYASLLDRPDNLFQGPDLLSYVERFPGILAGMVADPAGWTGLLPEIASGATRVQYLGLLPVCAVAVGMLRAIRRPVDRWWVGVALAGILLALGPFLCVGGEPVLVGGHRVPLPEALLAWVPVLGRMRLPHRWLLLWAVAGAVLVGRLLVDVVAGERRAGAWAATLVALVLLLDLQHFARVDGGARVDVTPPAVLAAIPEAPGDTGGTVLQLPPRLLGDDARGRYLAWQPVHDRPVPYALLMTGLAPSVRTEPLVVAFAALDSRDPLPDRPDDAAQLGLEAFAAAVASARTSPGPVGDRRAGLRALGVDVVVMHGALLDSADRPAGLQLLQEALGPATHEVPPDAVWILGDLP